MNRRRFLAGTVFLTGAAAAGMVPTSARAAYAADGRAVIDAHPRLLLHDFDGVRATIGGSQRAADWYTKVRADADNILDLPPVRYEIPDGRRLLSVSRETIRRTYSLALSYGMDGESVHAERLHQEMAAVAAFPDWNHHRHFLDTAEMTHAVAIAYDWLFDTWTEDQRALMRQAIVGHGLQPGMDAYETGAWWSTTTNNWNIVCNGGLTVGALTLAQDEPDLAAAIIDAALASVPRAIAEYAPDGGYPEGVGSYWAYATKYLVLLMETLTTATGDDRDMSGSPGLSSTGLFPIHLTGPTGGNFNYYDAGGGSPQPPEMFWLARRYSSPVFGWWGGLGADVAPIDWTHSPAALLWFDPDLVRSPIEAGLERDWYFGRCEVATMRSGWEDPNALFVGFKAGDNTTNHGDLDLGTFVLEAAGLRWADELGSDDYNLPGYFSGAPGGQRWTYYRKRAEGQNTLIVDPGLAEDQRVEGAGRIVARESGTAAAFAIAELTDAHDRFTSWRRGVRVDDHRRRVVVQDEFTTSPPVDAWWFLHTGSTIRIEPDGRSAVLERGGVRMLARLTSPADATFLNAPARPLWTSPDPSGQSLPGGMRKLTVRLRGVDDIRLTVQFDHLPEGGEVPGPAAVRPLDDWATAPAGMARLAELTVDGDRVPAFDPGTFTYTVELPPRAGVPQIAARTVSERGRVVVHRPDETPGVAVVEAIEPGRARARYHVVLSRAVGPGWFPQPILASTDDGNVPANTMDGDLGTRWSASGPGQWIAYDLGADGSVSKVRIAWYNGDQRSTRFDIEVAAADETDWRQVFSGSSSGDTRQLETYSFDQTTARYLRIVGYGNTSNAWNSITEVEIPGRSVDRPDETPYLADVRVVAPDSLPLGETARLAVEGTMSDGTPADLGGAAVEYGVDQPDVVGVDADGVVSAVSEGTASVSGIVVTPDDRRLEFGRRPLQVVDPTRRRFATTADTYVNDGPQADTNYGGSTSLTVKKVPAVDSGYNREAYLRFEPDAVAEPIVSVHLVINASVGDSNGTEIDLYAHLIDGFDESTTTWATRPTLGAQAGVGHVTDTRQWYRLDVTDAVTEAVRTGTPVSLALVQHPEGDNGLATHIASRETSDAPYLDVKLDV